MSLFLTFSIKSCWRGSLKVQIAEKVQDDGHGSFPESASGETKIEKKKINSRKEKSGSETSERESVYDDDDDDDDDDDEDNNDDDVTDENDESG